MVVAASSALSPPPDDQHPPVAVLLGLDELVGDLVRSSPGHAELARRAPPADGQQHAAGAEISLVLVWTGKTRHPRLMATTRSLKLIGTPVSRCTFCQ